ncbi:DDE-domain-containing protein [Trametes sanguinea]|nr:DDE-domain-containing protein [Trametes sanguinea]
MDLWLVTVLSSNILLSGEILRQKWKSFADRCGIPADKQLSLSNGWLEKFKVRHGLREFKRHGEAASANTQTVEDERLRIQKLPPDRGLSDKATAGVKGKKTRLTYAFTTNATGSDRLPPLIIGKYQKPRAFEGRTGKQLGFQYRHNAKAWMTTVLYREWIEDWDRKLVAEKRKVLLLQDNFSAHVPPETLKAIRVESFEPNLTAHVQPNDQGIIRCFKAHYRAKFIERAIDRYDSGVTPAQIYDINQLEAMRLADAAWKEVDAATIRHCWRKAGILPDFDHLSSTSPEPTIPVASLLQNGPDSEAPIAQAEKAVEQALDSLVVTGALQTANRMDINSLLNPQVETEVFSEVSEEDIFEAVQVAQNAVGNGNASDDISELAVEKPPTRKEVLQAASVILRFSSTLDDTAARKMESALASFTRQTRLDAQRAMKETTITQYFSRR